MTDEQLRSEIEYLRGRLEAVEGELVMHAFYLSLLDVYVPTEVGDEDQRLASFLRQQQERGLTERGALGFSDAWMRLQDQGRRVWAEAQEDDADRRTGD